MKKKILTICVAVIIALLCIWRLWPHSLKDILDIDEESFSSVTIQVSEFSVSNNSPNIDVYRLDISSSEDSNYASMMSIIQGTNFRSDFRNLLPWNVLTVSSGSQNITHSANVMLTWGDTNDFCYISFHGNSIVSFDISGKTEYLVYHPTNRTTLSQIVAYVKENGVFSA